MDPTKSPPCPVALNPDGRWLVPGSSDKTARLWDMQQPGIEPVILHRHEGAISAVAFSPDGRWLVTGSQDYTARLSRTELAELRHLACITVWRNLSAGEWEQFFSGQAYHKSYADLPSP